MMTIATVHGLLSDPSVSPDSYLTDLPDLDDEDVRRLLSSVYIIFNPSYHVIITWLFPHHNSNAKYGMMWPTSVVYTPPMPQPTKSAKLHRLELRSIRSMLYFSVDNGIAPRPQSNQDSQWIADDMENENIRTTICGQLRMCLSSLLVYCFRPYLWFTLHRLVQKAYVYTYTFCLYFFY